MPPVKTGRSGGILLPLLLTLILPSSCSVLEDREDCPCRLRVEVRKRCRLTPEREVRLRLRSEISDTRREESHTLSELQDYSIEMRVPKGTVRADGFVGLSHCRREDDVLTIPYGSDADSLYWASGAVEARGETAILPIRIRKEHVLFRLSFLHDGDGPYPFRPVIRSTTAGFRLTDGTPVEGPFRCFPRETADGCFFAVLPRQSHPDDLILEIRRQEDDPDGPPLTEIPLGRLISSSGAFSWEDEDLKDLLIQFDYANAAVTLQVSDWELGEVITCII
ncbi:MAG: hypothetical protein LIQ26_02020 [Bacteroidota bacterium]|nr:hypothetical protein [Bacteroidota bacterium]